MPGHGEEDAVYLKFVEKKRGRGKEKMFTAYVRIQSIIRFWRESGLSLSTHGLYIYIDTYFYQ